MSYFNRDYLLISFTMSDDGTFKKLQMTFDEWRQAIVIVQRDSPSFLGSEDGFTGDETRILIAALQKGLATPPRKKKKPVKKVAPQDLGGALPHEPRPHTTGFAPLNANESASCTRLLTFLKSHCRRGFTVERTWA